VHIDRAWSCASGGSVVPPYPRHHDMVLGQSRGDLVPGCVCPGMTVQQHDRRAGAPVPDPYGDLPTST
jgi:hypothetical protein